MLNLIVQFTVIILYIFRVFEWKWLTQFPLTTSCQHGKLPGAALNHCLIDNNYRQNPLYYRDTAQQLLSVAQSKIQDSYRGYKCTNCIPGSHTQNTSSCWLLGNKGQMSMWWKHSCTFGSLWQGYWWLLVAAVIGSARAPLLSRREGPAATLRPESSYSITHTENLEEIYPRTAQCRMCTQNKIHNLQPSIGLCGFVHCIHIIAHSVSCFSVFHAHTLLAPLDKQINTLSDKHHKWDDATHVDF